MLELSGSVDIFCEVRMALLLKIFIFFWLLPLHFDLLVFPCCYDVGFLNVESEREKSRYVTTQPLRPKMGIVRTIVQQGKRCWFSEFAVRRVR